ncbi:MAG: tetratricopeptide repeat protein [Planctomycetes bacterium]|nr:tetratricopeptide repeat protein [Planctomycetota bacterium]
MSNSTNLVVSTLCASAVAVVAALSFAPSTPAPAAPDPATNSIALERQLGELTERLAGLERELAARDAPVAARSAADVPTRADVERWVAEAVARRGDELGVAEAVGAAPFEIDRAVVELLEVGVNGGEAAIAIWARAREAGKVEELIAAFERRADADPRSADARADVGDAYVQAIIGAGDMLTQSLYGRKADDAYSRALELDPTHWRARFSKATGLTFWPDYLGKKPEAIEHFEILARQQEGSQPRPEFRATWIMLGNLYMQQGKEAEARSAWERGLAQFPNDPELSGKLGR